MLLLGCLMWNGILALNSIFTSELKFIPSIIGPKSSNFSSFKCIRLVSKFGISYMTCSIFFINEYSLLSEQTGQTSLVLPSQFYSLEGRFAVNDSKLNIISVELLNQFLIKYFYEHY